MKCRCEGKFVRSCVVETMRPSRTKYKQKSEQNRSKNRRRSTTNRRKSFLGGFWAFKAVSSTRRDPLGTRPGRSKAPPERFLDAQGVPREPGKRPKVFPSRSQDAPGPLRSSVRACLERRTLRTIFERFWLIAQKLRYAKNVAPASVLYTSDEVSTERAGASKKLEKPCVSASKIEPGGVRAT